MSILIQVVVVVAEYSSKESEALSFLTWKSLHFPELVNAVHPDVLGQRFSSWDAEIEIMVCAVADGLPE